MRSELKTLLEIVSATEARGAFAITRPGRGALDLKDCFLILAIPRSDTMVCMTGIKVDPQHAIDDASFEQNVAALDDPETWLSVGSESPASSAKKKA
jgi:hypothetical protein